MQGWTANKGIELQEKEVQEDHSVQETCLQKTYS